MLAMHCKALAAANRPVLPPLPLLLHPHGRRCGVPPPHGLATQVSAAAPFTHARVELRCIAHTCTQYSCSRNPRTICRLQPVLATQPSPAFPWTAAQVKTAVHILATGHNPGQD